MSKLPFYFHAPTPRYFRDAGHFNNPKNKAFVDWCFERCSPEERTVFEYEIKVVLKPYQFIFGRKKCSLGTGLSENEIRTQQKRWEDYGFLKKTTNKNPNRFTIYEWVLDRFLRCTTNQTTNRPPTDHHQDHHNQEVKKTRSKESHHPYPSSPDQPEWEDERTGTDDFFSVEEDQECNITSTIRPQVTDIVDLLAEDRKKHEILSPYNLPDKLLKELTQYPVDHLKDAVLAFDDYRASKAKKGVNLHNPRVELRNAIVEGWKREETPSSNQDAKVKALDAVNESIKESVAGHYQTHPEPTISIEVYPGVCLTQEELAACIAIKGSQEAVASAIDYIMRSPGRKRKISNWPNALSTWEIKPDIKPRLKEHEEMAQRLSKTYEDYYQGLGYRCCIYNDRKKDQRGILFEPQSSYQDVFFVPFIDGEFKEKVSKFLRDKKMQLGRISAS